MTPQGDLVFTDFSRGGLVVHILTAACHLCVLMCIPLNICFVCVHHQCILHYNRIDVSRFLMMQKD